MSRTLTVDAIHDLVAHVAGTDYKQLPAEAVQRARWGILDTLGAALAGTRHAAIAAVEKVTRSSGGFPQATAVGWDGKRSVGDAGLINTASGRAFDFDDIHFSIGHHPSISNVSAALAVAELSGATGRDVLTAVALGQDFGLRIRRACPLRLGGHTWAAQSYASLESALTAGKVLGLDATRLRHAVGIAFCFFGGTPQSQHDGATAHLVHHGSGTRAGIMAALYAAEGITGAENVLEGEFGLYPAYHKGQFNRALLLDGLGEQFLGTEAGFKAYPTCSLIHGAIDAARSLREELGPVPSEVESVRVEVNRSAYISCARQPWSPPATPTEAQFSIPFAVALALVHGHVRLGHLTPEALTRCRAVLDVAARVQPVHDEQLDKVASQVAPTTVMVRLRDGRTASRCVTAAKGYPENPLTDDELRAKFRDCAAFARVPRDAARAERVLGLVDRFDELTNVAEVMRAV